MSGAHTPGPWWPTDHGVRDVGGYIAHFVAVQRYEGQDERYAREVAQRRADKALIAASPDLLEALRAAVDCHLVPQLSAADGGAAVHSRQVQVADMIRAAIAKAEGRTS